MYTNISLEKQEYDRMVQHCSWLDFDQEVGRDEFLKSRQKHECYESMNI